jgi:hypothetical protein
MAPTITTKLAQDQTFIRSLSGGVSKEVTSAITKDFQNFAQELMPVIELATAKSTTQAVASIEQRMATHLAAYEVRRQADAAKIDGLTAHVNNLNAALRELVEQQAKFKGEVMAQLGMQKKQDVAATAPAPGHAAKSSISVTSNAAEKALPEDSANLKNLMDTGKAEEAFVAVCFPVLAISVADTNFYSGCILDPVKEKSLMRFSLITILVPSNPSLLLSFCLLQPLLPSHLTQTC